MGKGRNKRHMNHYTVGYLRAASHKNFIIKRYRSLGFVDSFAIIESSLTESEAYKLEIDVIASLNSRKDGGVLVNQAHGGQGSAGISIPRTPEWKANIAAAHRGKKLSASHIENSRKARIGMRLTEAHKAKLSASLKGIPKTPEHIAAAAAGLRGHKRSPEHNAKLRGNLHAPIGKWHRVTSPEGEVFIVRPLKSFCVERGLSNQHLGAVALGHRQHHRGWKAEFCDAQGNIGVSCS